MRNGIVRYCRYSSPLGEIRIASDGTAVTGLWLPGQGGEEKIAAMGATFGDDELLRMADYYQQGKPVADKLKTIRFDTFRQKYKAEHENVLRTFYMAARKLKNQWVDEKLPVHAWRKEKSKLETEYQALQQKIAPLYADTKKLWAIHYSIYQVQHEQERQNAVTRQKKQEIEH